MIKLSRGARGILLFAAAAALLGQGEGQPYFGLHSGDTFRSGGSPTVSLTAWNVDSLQFRVYRVRNAEQFFRQLQEPHSFGGFAPRPPHTKSLLEKLRSWKQGLKADIRRSLRAQYSEPPHTQFESLFPKEAKPVTKTIPGEASQYAEAPLLNPDQLVMSFVHPVHGHERWESETVDIPVKDRGVYLVEAVNKDLRAYTILMVSDLALITKIANGRVVNFLMDRATGQPVSGATIAGFVKRGEPARSETDGNGIAELKVAPGNENEISVLARTDNDLAVNGLWAGNGGGEWNGYVYTDRPVYRPGHTVHFRAIVRTRGVSGYQVPSGHKLLVRVEDPEQKPVYQKTLTVGTAGTIHDELTLPAAAALGNYSVSVKPDSDSQYSYIYGNFEVQEYKKPEYSVRVTPSKPRTIQGETVQATIDAQYFFGEPVAGAKVKYRIYKQRYWSPLWYDADDAGDEPGGEAERDDDFGGDQQSEQTGELDANGKLTISISATVSDHKLDTLYRIEAGVTDAANREVSGTGWLIATYGSFAVNVAPESYIYAPGQQGGFAVQARDYDNKPIHTRVHLELHRQRRGKEDNTVLASADAETDAAGSAKANLTMPRDAGSYLVRVTAHTPEGRDVEDIAYIWNEGGGQRESESRDQSVQIITDKKSYRVGETAKLMIVAGQPGTAVYVTVGSRNIEEYRLLRAQDATVSFEVPLTAQSEPGISVNASFVRNGVLYSSDKYVRVPPVEHTLSVRISTDKPQYQPGQSAAYSIDVTGADGKPVPRAEFSLGVVDEAIYGVRRDTTQDIVSFFYGRDFRTPSTSSSLSYDFNGEAGKRRMQLAELRPRSHLAQLKPERLVQPKVRKAFPDTAFWAADLTTDAAGHARAEIDFPDSLTTWRATARGVTPDTRVGNSTLKTIVRKNIIVRLAAPRFFVRGDEVTIPVIVHNYLTDAKTARVSLDVTGLDVLDGATKDVPIPGRGEVTVNWKVRAQQATKATLTAKALTNEESDALQLDLPVHFAGIQLAIPHGGSAPAGESAAFDISYPQNVEPGSRLLRIQVSPSIAGSLFGALEYLTSFPYGCVEQTMSSFLPDIVVQDTVRNLHLKMDLDDSALQEKIHAGLDRLYGFQHPDGGWGWWETDDSHPFMTAYVVSGLAQARDAGVPITPDVIHKGAVWLNREFSDDPKLVPDFRAYLVYSLGVAGELDGKALNQVYEKRSDLSSYGLALLGLALEQRKDGRVGEIADTLASRAKQDQEQAWWPATRDPMLDFESDATPESTAFAMRLLSRVRPNSPLLPKAALWLLNHRDEGYWWGSTKQTAMVIYALTDYLKATKELTPNLTATVFVNGKAVLTRKMTDATSLNPPEIVLDEAALQQGVNHIRVTSSGEGRLYYTVRGEYYSNNPGLQKTGTTSLNLLRDYFRLVPTKELDRIVYDTVPLDGPVTVGDLIAVRLTVTGSEWKYMMVEDPIPAGTEFVEKDQLYTLKDRPSWWGYIFDRREMHDDRMAIFQTWFKQGQTTYFYLLKVVNPGTFEVGPARVGPMYQPDVMATTESRRLVSR